MPRLPVVHRWYLWLLACTALAGLPHLARADDVARARPYTWTRAPLYARSADRGDSVQLTDGESAGGAHIWLDRRCVGWQATRGDAIGVCIDLGRRCWIDSVIVCSATFPPAEVIAPALLCATGEAPAQLAWAGALDAGTLAAPDSVHAHRARLRVPMAAAGRYVLVAALLRSPYFFADEIEVHGRAVAPGIAVAAPQTLGPLGRRFGNADLAVAAAAARRAWALRAALPDGGAPATQLARVAVAAEESLRLMARARAWRTAGVAPLVVRRVDPWTPTTPWSDLQAARTDTLDLWPGAWEAAALEVANATLAPVQVAVTVNAAAPGAPALTAREVVHVEARDGRWCGDALPCASGALVVRPGEVRQVWIDVHAPAAASGVHLLQVRVASQAVELAVRVHAVRMPAPPLHALDWIYPRSMPLPRSAPAAAVDDNAAHGIDTWWIGSDAIPWPAPHTIDASGHLTSPLDFTACDRELALQHASDDAVIGFFWNFDAHRDDPSGGRFRHPYDSPAWRQAVREWLDAWIAHLGALGLDRRRFVMQPFDESTVPAVARCFRTLHALRPDLPLALTITRLALPAELQALESDLTLAIVERRTLFARRAWIRAAAAHGTQVWTYDVPQPAKAIAPLAGYRGLAWEAWARGLAGCAFWAYGDAGAASADAWDDFDGTHPDFAVVYGRAGAPRALTEDFVPSKRWQAFRIGMQETALFAAVAARDSTWPEVVVRALAASDTLRAPARLRRAALEKLE